MKVFWSIIAVLLVAAVAAAFIPRGDDSPSLVVTGEPDAMTSGQPERPAGDGSTTASTDDDEPADDESAAESGDKPSADAPDASTSDSDDTEATSQPANAVTAPGDTDSNDDTALTNVATDPATDDDATAAPSAPGDQPGDDSGSSEELTTAEATETTESSEPSDAAEAGGADLLNATVVEQPDGSLLIADKYTVRGSGETDDPYVVPWDLLVSLTSVYRPREGQKELPEFIMRLHNKQVEITGYVAFPLVSGEIEELLVMLNQWDGCCVGVPPTVYDSVEVRLIEPIRTTGASTTMPYGTVTGRMTIDPYFVNDWLVGLYLMEEAAIEMDL